jgi:hypothetical protein
MRMLSDLIKVNPFRFLAKLISGSVSPKEIARVPYSNGYCILRDDATVLVQCSGGTDILLLALVSEELQTQFLNQLEKKKK